MEATQILSNEHRVIESVLDAMQQAVAAAQQGKNVRPGFFLDAAGFIRGFADGCHHLKEEKVLFEALRRNGIPAENSPVGVMLQEHAAGRNFAGAMREGAERWQAGDLNGEKEALRSAQGYLALLRQHIYKEDNILFPLADRVIPEDQQPEVLDAFEKVEHEETGEGVHEMYLSLANALIQEARTWS